MGYPYVLFGIFGIITYTLYYFIWAYLNPIGYESLSLRLGAVLLCILLVLKKYWPKKIQPLFPLYWYFTLLYALPFLFTFFLLKNNFSTAWTLNALTVVVLSILLLDLIPLLVILTLGISLGIFVYHLSSNTIPLAPNYKNIIVTYFSVLLFGALFARNKENIQQEKIEAIKSVGASIAHELRTPLGSISAGAKGINNYFPILIDVYQLAKKNNLPIPEIQFRNIELLQSELENIEMETQYANTIINMLLVKINAVKTINTAFDRCSIAECIGNSLSRYPFNPPEQIKLIHWNDKNDFMFEGAALLFVHVIFNLLKNSLYYISGTQDSRIYLTLEQKEKHNVLYFKDTGKGIPTKTLPHVFQLFYSNTCNGAGVGLAFCKMVMKSFGGDIACHSVENEFTEFTLTFPKIK